jgi:small redox-active disulfide protein 2
MAADIRQIKVKGVRIGVVGLAEECARLAGEAGAMSESEQRELLLERLAAVNYIPAGMRAEYAAAFWREYRKFRGEAVPDEVGGGLVIKVLGPGCPRCEQLLEEVRNLLAREGLEAEVEHVTDLEAIAAFGPLATPALVIDGRVKSTGRIPPPGQILKWIQAEQ